MWIFQRVTTFVDRKLPSMVFETFQICGLLLNWKEVNQFVPLRVVLNEKGGNYFNARIISLGGASIPCNSGVLDLKVGL